jgi:hypothetical protein
MQQQLWRELFTRASSVEGDASKQLAPRLLHLFLKDPNGWNMGKQDFIGLENGKCRMI